MCVPEGIHPHFSHPLIHSAQIRIKSLPNNLFWLNAEFLIFFFWLCPGRLVSNEIAPSNHLQTVKNNRKFCFFNSHFAVYAHTVEYSVSDWFYSRPLIRLVLYILYIMITRQHKIKKKTPIDSLSWSINWDNVRFTIHECGILLLSCTILIWSFNKLFS